MKRLTSISLAFDHVKAIGLLIAIATIFLVNNANAQVKVGSNPATIQPTSNLEVEGSVGGSISKMAVTKDSSKVGIGTTSPTNKLHVIAGSNPVRIEGLSNGTGTETFLTIDANGIVKKQALNLTIPTVRVIARRSANWNAASNGALLAVPLDVTDINDGNFNTSTATYTVPSTAVYQISGFLDMTTTGSSVAISFYAIINGGRVLLNDLSGGPLPNPYALRLAGSATLKLNAGDTVSLATLACQGCGGSYTGITPYTNMTIIKVN